MIDYGILIRDTSAAIAIVEHNITQISAGLLLYQIAISWQNFADFKGNLSTSWVNETHFLVKNLNGLRFEKQIIEIGKFHPSLIFVSSYYDLLMVEKNNLLLDRNAK